MTQVGRGHEHFKGKATSMFAVQRKGGVKGSQKGAEGIAGAVAFLCARVEGTNDELMLGAEAREEEEESGGSSA
eukprot:1064161-Amphidinium_carterae.1